MVPSVLLQWLFFKDMAIFEMIQHGSQEVRAARWKQRVSARHMASEVQFRLLLRASLGSVAGGHVPCRSITPGGLGFLCFLAMRPKHICKVNHCMLLQVQTAAPSRQLRILQSGTRLRNVSGHERPATAGFLGF